MTNPERVPLSTLLSGGDGKKLGEIGRAVGNGALFVYPTETIYGIGGVWNAPGMRERILLAKNRPPENPFILIAPDIAFFKDLPVVFPPAALALALKFWPGMLTIVLPSSTDPRGIAVRVCNHPFIIALYNYISVPLFSTSANQSGEAYVNDPSRIFSRFSGTIDFMIDAGPLPPSPPSTVVKVDHDDRVTIIREGAIPREALLERAAINRAPATD